MKEGFECYAVIPPDETYLDDFKLRESIGLTERAAWYKFCGVGLRREGYEADGFKAKKVMVTIKEL